MYIAYASKNWHRSMADTLIPQSESSQPVVYQIRVKDHLGTQWADWFEGFTITEEDDGLTLLAGPVVDQAALHGLLKRIRDLGMILISVNSAGPDAGEVHET